MNKGLSVLFIGSCCFMGQALAQSPSGDEMGFDPPVVQRGAKLMGPAVIPAVIDTHLLMLPQVRDWQPGDPIYEVPQFLGAKPIFHEPRQPNIGDPLRDMADDFRQSQRTISNYQIDVDVDGTNFTGVNPADPVGDVGNQYYIQAVNQSGGTRILIVDKSNGATVTDFELADLALGSGTNCSFGFGDPIVMFDESVGNGVGQPTGRWILTEFTGNSMCVYVSQSDDPVAGGWYLYEFLSDSGSLPDYPKYGVWPDAYFAGSKESSPALPRIYAFDRVNMVNGAPATAQFFSVPPLAAFSPWQMLLPADWDGAVAPGNSSTGLFFRHKDDEAHTPGSADPSKDFLEIWEFDVDWINPANSTLSGPVDVDLAEFDAHLCGLGFPPPCVLQPSGPSFFLPSPAMMWRMQYRNFGSHESIVGSFMVDADGADLYGVRWFELRNGGSGWSKHQEGTVSPDSTYRFLPSVAMDAFGDILLAYNVSDDTSVFPGIRYSGRFVGDPLNQLTHTELDVVTGTTSNSSSRYGDYNAMTVDPVDGSTFWFTAMYNQNSTWSTRITSFILPNGAADLSLDKKGQCLRLTPTGLKNCPFSFPIGIQPNDWFVFTLTVKNAGPQSATNVEVRDVIPAGLTFFNAAASIGGYNVVTGLWSIPALAAGQTVTLSILTAAGSALNNVQNFAEVWSVDQDDPDSTPGNGWSNCREDDDDRWGWPLQIVCFLPIDPTNRLRWITLDEVSGNRVSKTLSLQPSDGIDIRRIQLGKTPRARLAEVIVHDGRTKFDAKSMTLAVFDNEAKVTLVYEAEDLDAHYTEIYKAINADGLERVSLEKTAELVAYLEKTYQLNIDLITANGVDEAISTSLYLLPELR